jgi:hypothetical protein
MKNRSWTVIFVVVVTAVSLGGWLAARQIGGVSGFPLDDAWIHQTYARSLASGDGWSFIPGVPSAGATAPLWVVLLVPGYFLGLEPFAWIVVLAALQIIVLGLLGAASWRLLDLENGKWAAAAGGLLILEWHLVWGALSGMETLLVGLLALAVFAWLLSLDQKNGGALWPWFGLGVLIGVGAWVRPEAVTLLGPVGMTALFLRGEKPVERAKRLAAAGVGFLVIFGVYLLFNHWLAGSWWPNTFYAKQAEYAELKQITFFSRLLTEFSPLMAGVMAVVLPGFAVNVFYSIKNRRWAALSGGLWALGHVVLYAWRLPVIYQHGRYVIPALPILVLLGFAGFKQSLDAIKTERTRWLAIRAWGGVIVVFLILFWVMGMQSYLEDVAFIDGEMVQTALWIEENTSEDALIAAHDIGAIGYFAQRPILDLAGLVSPDVIPFIRDEDQLAAYLDEICPRYLVTFPDWYDLLPEMGGLVYQTDTTITVEIGGTNMAVYTWIGEGRCP